MKSGEVAKGQVITMAESQNEPAAQQSLESLIAEVAENANADILLINSPYAVTRPGNVNVRKVENAACRALR